VTVFHRFRDLITIYSYIILDITQMPLRRGISPYQEKPITETLEVSPKLLKQLQVSLSKRSPFLGRLHSHYMLKKMTKKITWRRKLSSLSWI